jgi:hypothetical protein
MTKLTPAVRATIRDVVEKQSSHLSPEMRAISCSTIRDHLRDEHGILLRTCTIRRFTERLTAPR